MKLSWELPYPSGRMPVFARNMVAASQPLAAQAGLRLLREGGNAVDAALAAAIALTVVEPTNNGIGSDAFAMVWDGNALHGFNGSGRSPRRWTPERFAGRTEMPFSGWDSVTVPGAVDAWVRLAERFGSVPFAKLFEPAIEYAREGFLVSPKVAVGWAEAAELFGDLPSFASTFLRAGQPPGIGQLVRIPDQAETLAEIAATRGESFYRGALARKIAEQAQKEGGALHLDDLEEHCGFWTSTLTQSLAGATLHEIPPNGQGIAALVALGILRHCQLDEHHVDSPLSIHLQVEALKLAFREVHRHVADPASMVLSPEALLAEDFLGDCARQIDRNRASPPSPAIAGDRGTVYLAAADGAGRMVSFIQSNFKGFGSGVVVSGTGIALQNRGWGFSLEPGHPNRVGGAKLPFHTIIPGFVTRDGQPLMSFGVMGGHMQAQGHVQMMVRIFLHGQNPQAACDAPRWHLTEDHQLALECGFPPALSSALERLGHRLVKNPHYGLFGGAQLILRLANGYCGASDHRKDGHAAGF